MGVSNLIATVPTLDEPTCTAPDGQRFEGELGMRLPEDYKQAAAFYGDGCFGDFVHLHQSISHNRHHDLLQRRRRTDLDALRVLRREPRRRAR